MRLPILKFISEDKDGHQIYEVTYDDGSKATLHGFRHPLFDSAQPRRDITLKPVAVKRKRRVDEFVDNIMGKDKLKLLTIKSRQFGLDNLIQAEITREMIKICSSKRYEKVHKNLRVR